MNININVNDFCSSLEKIAISIRGLRSIQKIIKPKLIRKRSIATALEGGGIKVSIVKDGTAAYGIAKEVPKEIAAQFPKSLLPFKGKIITGKGGIFKATKTGGEKLTKMYGIKKITPPKSKIQREALSRVTLMHEFSETVHGGKKYFPIIGHNSPAVILRESNLVRSLPKRYTPVKRYMKRFREIEGTEGIIQIVYPNFQYGKTKLSPAGKKYILKSLKKMRE